MRQILVTVWCQFKMTGWLNVNRWLQINRTRIFFLIGLRVNAPYLLHYYATVLWRQTIILKNKSLNWMVAPSMCCSIDCSIYILEKSWFPEIDEKLTHFDLLGLSKLLVYNLSYKFTSYLDSGNPRKRALRYSYAFLSLVLSV